MKKILLALVAIVALFGLTLNVNAMTSDELLAKAKETYTVNGKEVQLRTNVIAQVEMYLKSEANDLTSDQMDLIAKNMDKAIAIAKNAKASSWNELTAAQKQEIIDLAAEIEDETSLTIELTLDGSLTVSDKEGKYLVKNLKDAVQPVEKAKEDGADISNTNSYDVATIILGGISLVGLLLVTRKVVKANA